MNEPISLSKESIVNKDKLIGAILLDAGRISTMQAEQVLRLQKTKDLKFGEAAQSLGFISEQDVQQALALQFDYPYVQTPQSKLSPLLVAATRPQATSVEACRALRTQLLLRYFSEEKRTLSVVSSSAKEGKSVLIANLAVVFSQLGERTLLVDANFRTPILHTLFGLDAHVGLSDVLAGRADSNYVYRVPGLGNLSVIPAGTVPPNPQELLSKGRFETAINAGKSNYDVVLIDTSSLEQSADATMVSARAGAAIVVARRNVTGISKCREAIESLLSSGVDVVGTVYNEF